MVTGSKFINMRCFIILTDEVTWKSNKMSQNNKRWSSGHDLIFLDTSGEKKAEKSLTYGRNYL